MDTITVDSLALVEGAPGYRVVEAGTYAMLDFVPCRREHDTNGPVCQFLGATVAGIDPSEVQA